MELYRTETDYQNLHSPDTDILLDKFHTESFDRTYQTDFAANYKHRFDRQHKKLFKSGGCYYLQERNGREVRIGELTITDKIFVNPSEDGLFDCFFCAVKFSGLNEKKYVQIPYREFVRHQILPHLHGFPRNPDCPDRYITMAFFMELMDGDDVKLLQLPPHYGWNHDEQHSYFATAERMIPQLSVTMRRTYIPDGFHAQIHLLQMPPEAFLSICRRIGN